LLAAFVFTSQQTRLATEKQLRFNKNLDNTNQICIFEKNFKQC